jgi:amidase
VGLKPGRGLVPAGESTGDPAGLVVSGPLARSAADAALLLDAMIPGPADTPAKPAPSYLERAAQDPPRLRIGVSLDSPWQTIFPFTPDPEALDALADGIGARRRPRNLRRPHRYQPYPATSTAWTAAEAASFRSARLS